MSHPLRDKVRAVGRRVSRLALLHGLASLAAVTLSIAFFLGLADYLLRLNDFGVRLICWAGLVAVLAAGVYYVLYPALVFRPTDLQIARRIEQYYPPLADRLSSALAFLDQSEQDATAGSASLRRAVVSETEAAVESLNFEAAIDPRKPRRMALVAVGVFVLVGVICLIDPASAALAARRLVAPWTSATWPRRNDLAFVDPPQRLAAGDDFEVSLIDNKGRLPDVVKIAYWFDGDREDQAQVKEMRPLDEKMVHRVDNVSRPFKYRALGGDDDSMPWHELFVAEPPRVASLKLKLVPPEYTGWKSEEAGKQARALEGTRIEASGLANKPLSAVRLRSDEDGSTQLVGRLSADRKSFFLPADPAKPLLLSKSSNLTLEIVDQDGVKGGSESRWEIVVVPDRPPTVSLEKPAGNTFVTAAAMLPVRAIVKDDLGVATVELRYIRSDQTEQGEQTVVLYPASGQKPAPQIAKLGDQADKNESPAFDYPWDLSKLPGLKPGVSLMFHVAAGDHKPQFGRCLPQRLVIISSDELQDRLAQRQANILGQLADVLKAERASRAQTKSLEIQLTEAGKLSKSDVDQLQSAELNQREVQRLLVDPTAGVENQVASLLSDLASNRVDNPDTERRMSSLQETIRELGTGPLPLIQRDLTEALKTARAAVLSAEGQTNPADSAAVSRPLVEAGKNQDQVVSVLEQLLGDLSQWESYRRFSREISQIRREQDEIRKQTDPLRLKTLGKDAQDLTPQERADVKRLAESQFELGRQFDKIQSRMGQTRERLRETDPLAAETMADALDAARRLAVSGQMRESGTNLERNQVGQAARTQEEISRGLDEMLDVLANRREHELGRLVKKLREAASEMDELRGKEQALQKKLDTAAKGTAPEQRKAELKRLSKEQQALAEQANRLARRLKRLQAEQAGDKTAQAGEQLGQSSESGEKDQGEKALEEAQQGEKQLADAQQQLEQDVRKAEQDLLREQIARLEQEIGGLVARQQGLLDRTHEIDMLKDAEGHLAREPLQSLLALAREQRALGGETGAAADKLAESPTFELALRGATREMLHAAGSLDARDPGTPTQQAQTAALNRLNQLLAALKPAEKEPGDEPENNAGGQGGGNQNDPPPAGRVQALAELKLLKLLQLEINRRTIELEEVRAKGKNLSDEQLAQLEELGREQGRLADLIAKLMRSPDAALPEDDPDSLPKLERPPQEKSE